MHTFTIRDLRDRTGELVRTAEEGELSLVTKHGQPVFVAIPLDSLVLEHGVKVALAISFFKEKALSLKRAASFAEMPLAKFMRTAGGAGVPIIEISDEELDQEMAILRGMTK